VKVFFLFSLLVIHGYCYSQVISICSWNLKDFGNSKDDRVIAYIARIVKDFDIIAVPEVVAGEGGIETVERLYNALLNYDKSWDYSVSEPTFSSAYKTERYAFLWRSNRVKLTGDAWLEERYKLEIDREPYFASFIFKKMHFTLVNFHAITKSRQPETEVKYFRYFPEEYPRLNLIFCGDFNLPELHSVFNPLKKMGYEPALTGQKTSLRDRCLSDGCLASELDNFFLKSSEFQIIDRGVIHFYNDFKDFQDARKISDHVPVYIRIKAK